MVFRGIRWIDICLKGFFRASDVLVAEGLLGVFTVQFFFPFPLPLAILPWCMSHELLVSPDELTGIFYIHPFQGLFYIGSF